MIVRGFDACPPTIGPPRVTLVQSTPAPATCHLLQYVLIIFWYVLGELVLVVV